MGQLKLLDPLRATNFEAKIYSSHTFSSLRETLSSSSIAQWLFFYYSNSNGDTRLPRPDHSATVWNEHNETPEKENSMGLSMIFHIFTLPGASTLHNIVTHSYQ